MPCLSISGASATRSWSFRKLLPWRKARDEEKEDETQNLDKDQSLVNLSSPTKRMSQRNGPSSASKALPTGILKTRPTSTATTAPVVVDVFGGISIIKEAVRQRKRCKTFPEDLKSEVQLEQDLIDPASVALASMQMIRSLTRCKTLPAALSKTKVEREGLSLLQGLARRCRRCNTSPEIGSQANSPGNGDFFRDLLQQIRGCNSSPANVLRSTSSPLQRGKRFRIASSRRRKTTGSVRFDKNISFASISIEELKDTHRGSSVARFLGFNSGYAYPRRRSLFREYLRKKNLLVFSKRSPKAQSAQVRFSRRVCVIEEVGSCRIAESATSATSRSHSPKCFPGYTQGPYGPELQVPWTSFIDSLPELPTESLHGFGIESESCRLQL